MQAIVVNVRAGQHGADADLQDGSQPAARDVPWDYPLGRGPPAVTLRRSSRLSSSEGPLRGPLVGKIVIEPSGGHYVYLYRDPSSLKADDVGLPDHLADRATPDLRHERELGRGNGWERRRSTSARNLDRGMDDRSSIQSIPAPRRSP
jgi:hypothetical protein